MPFPNEVKINVKGSGQECPLHTCNASGNINVKTGAAGVCGSHPCAENAQGWGTLGVFEDRKSKSKSKSDPKSKATDRSVRSTRAGSRAAGGVAALPRYCGRSLSRSKAGAKAQLLSEAFIAALEALRHPKSLRARRRSGVNIKSNVKGNAQECWFYTCVGMASGGQQIPRSSSPLRGYERTRNDKFNWVCAMRHPSASPSASLGASAKQGRLLKSCPSRSPTGQSQDQRQGQRTGVFVLHVQRQRTGESPASTRAPKSESPADVE